MKKDGNSVITKKDILILKKLLEDGRKSSSSISKEIDLGREIINYRIKRLIKENLIVKFIPQINDKAIHYQEYLILLKLNLEDNFSKEEFIKNRIGNKYLAWVIKSNSGWDLIVRLFADSFDSFKEKLSEVLEIFSEVLTSYYTIISSDEIKEDEKRAVVENLFNEKVDDNFILVKSSNNRHVQIDDKDKKILELLEKDGRIQYKEIADRLEISADTVKYRIDKMKEQDIIRNFVPIINFSKLGLLHYAGILRFHFLNPKQEDCVCKFLKNNNFVIKAIKSLNAEEFFVMLLFDDEKQVDFFKKDLNENFGDKLDFLELFRIG